MNIVDINCDNVPEYMDRGAWVNPASLMDESGKVLWMVPDGFDTDDMAMGDVNGDEQPEFVVGYNGGTGVRLLDVSGKEIWKLPSGNVWHVDMVDINGDGKDEIIHSGQGLNILDGQSKVIFQQPNPKKDQEGIYFSHFDVVNWPDSSSTPHIIQNGEGMIWIVNLDGSIAKKLDAPERARVGETFATLVRLNPSQPEYLAVLVDYNIWDVAVLYVYDNTGKLLYDEVFPSSAPALTAAKLGDDDTETLLVGSGATVWMYVMK
jgi:hypothetical protein